MERFRIEWKTSALKELRRIDRRMVPRIIEAVESLADEPNPAGAVKLRQSKSTYRLRVGDYRVVYEVLEARLLVYIVRVRHRRDVYRQQ